MNFYLYLKIKYGGMATDNNDNKGFEAKGFESNCEIVLSQEKITSIALSEKFIYVITGDFLRIIKKNTQEIVYQTDNVTRLLVSPSGDSFVRITRNGSAFFSQPTIKRSERIQIFNETISFSREKFYLIGQKCLVPIHQNGKKRTRQDLKDEIAVVDGKFLRKKGSSIFLHKDIYINENDTYVFVSKNKYIWCSKDEITIYYNGDIYKFKTNFKSPFLWIHPEYPVFATFSDDDTLNFCDIKTGNFFASINVKNPQITRDANYLYYYNENVLYSINISFLFLRYNPFHSFVSGMFSYNMKGFFVNTLYDRNVLRIIHSFL